MAYAYITPSVDGTYLFDICTSVAARDKTAAASGRPMNIYYMFMLVCVHLRTSSTTFNTYGSVTEIPIIVSSVVIFLGLQRVFPPPVKFS